MLMPLIGLIKILAHLRVMQVGVDDKMLTE
jgi:hypothetical protein